MGNSFNLCVDNKSVSKLEILSDDTGISDDYKKKTKSDEVLKVLVPEKIGASAKNYTKGQVKVIVL
jgi:hypothetical protein